MFKNADRKASAAAKYEHNCHEVWNLTYSQALLRPFLNSYLPGFVVTVLKYAADAFRRFTLVRHSQSSSCLIPNYAVWCQLEYCHKFSCVPTDSYASRGCNVTTKV